MVTRVRSNPLVRLLRACSLLLVVILLAEVVLMVSGIDWLLPGNSERSPVFGGAAIAIKPLEPAAFYQEAVDRSLFSWNRRPVVSEEEPELEEALNTRWELAGVVNTGESVYAMFSEINGNTQLRLGAGMYLEQWKIESIDSEQVLLKNDEEETVFRMRETDHSKKETKVPDKRQLRLQKRVVRPESSDNADGE